MADLSSAILAIATDDADAFARRLEEQPGLATAALRDELFVDAIVHQLYAGDTLLHVAAAGFRAGMVATLLDKGADVATCNRRGAQPLHYAADANRYAPDDQAATIGALIDAGADANAVDRSGVAPLHRAVRKRGSAAVAALLDGGADPNLRNGSGSTPLHLAVQTTGSSGSGTSHAKSEQAEIIRLLLARGADPDARDGNGRTAREIAAAAKLDLA